ncbi:MAG: cysteine peptidase family C39 domain-containing protein [Leptolyngbyaceae bacterium]|nr:cysteine peptidase family C39 domain-containing protein [Leptolyngbyaceae bacterium]
MPLDTTTTIALSSLVFIWGRRLGRSLLQRGATANDLFKGRNPLSLAFLGCYVCFMVAILNVPQMTVFPLEWRFHGMQITWGLMHLTLAALCGMSITISWHTARSQVITVALIGIVGVATFSGFESFLLSPIHAQLHDDLQPNGVFRQTSNSSCAPAAMATVLRQWGLPATESWVAELAGTSRMGTSMPQLIVAAQTLNLDGIELSPTWELMQQINRPGILAVWLIDDDGKKLPHAVALLGLTDDTATIADPAEGEILKFSRADLAEIWRQQYVPIIRPGDRTMSTIEASMHLRELGYLGPGRPIQDFRSPIEAFQVDHHLSPTGKLDIETSLALSGPFLNDAPRLDFFQRETEVNRM